MKKRLYTLAFALLGIFAVTMAFGSSKKTSKQGLHSSYAPQQADTIKLLAIGNSFSEDALEYYLHGLAAAEGIPIIIGNLYIGGASLALHAENARNDTARYSYRKIGIDGEKITTPNISIAKALADEKWTHISLQQASPNSGQYNTWAASLPQVYDYVTSHVHHDVQFVLHQTWAYAKNSTHEGFANYGKDQQKMYEAIVNAVDSAKNLVHIDLVVPVGTAIQNARTSSIGDNFTRDGYHLDLGIGRYTASCTWYEMLFGKSVIGNPYKPEALSDKDVKIAQYAAHFAVTNPNAITPMTDF
ncbi:DUF4886 domain-containing protein [Olivibacter sitiensis]|uniref:DUF4886 domain-containing protein n=1 Tax=Olivibacter sitiensis TaxID=376470 RepID=UPI001B7FD0FC|nr:DUF4886 domain-containing protein [Olivibacter sitiensis]